MPPKSKKANKKRARTESDDDDYEMSGGSESESTIQMPSAASPQSVVDSEEAIQMPAYKTPPKARKKPRKSSEAPDEPPTEKRLARFKLKCPEDVRERYVLTTKKYYVLGRHKVSDLEEEFKIGTTNNVEIDKIFNVSIAQRPRCDCPHGKKGLNHCEHILIVLWRVLRIPQSSNLWYQKALLTSELKSIFADAPPASLRAKSSDKMTETEAYDCPVCFSRFYDVINRQPALEMVWCDECGEAVHRGCQEQWRKVNGMTCVSCGPLASKDA
ncbi:hypothetical protein CPB85DRAFT_1291034 [Mucidula mucida]|nr:hypothetical protein CPB85DRAFT_1291034 [Mucidula mucida]